MGKVSIIEVKNALLTVGFEVQTEEGILAMELLYKYLEEQRLKQIKEGTLIVKK